MSSTSEDVKAMKAAAGVTSGEALSPPSDNDGGERPVRKQLKETSIESAPTNETGNGRKRSFDEARDDVHDPNENGDSSRKRSRESTPEDSKLSNSAAGKDTTGSALAQNVSNFAPKSPHGHKAPQDTQDFKVPKDPFSTITTPHPMDMPQENPQSATITQEPHGVSASMEVLEEQQFPDPTSAALESLHSQSSDEWVTTSDDESVSPMEYEETLEAGTGLLFAEESSSSRSRSQHSSDSESTGPNSDESDSDEYDFYEYDSYLDASSTTASKSTLDDGESESTGSHSDSYDSYDEYDEEEYFSAEEESVEGESVPADEHAVERADESEEYDSEEPEEHNPDPLSATPGSPQSHISDGSVDPTPGSDEESGSASPSEAEELPKPSAGPEKVTSQAAEPSSSSSLDLAEVLRRRPKMKAIAPYWSRKERDFQRQKDEAERAEQAEQSQEESVEDYDDDDDTDGSRSGVEEEISTPSPTEEHGAGALYDSDDEEQASLPPSPSGADAESAYGNTFSPQDPQDTESEKNDDANNRLQEATNPAIDGASANTSSQTGGSEDEPAKAPKKKRSREQLEENAEEPEGLGADAQAPPRSEAADEKPATGGEPEKKRHRDNSQERETKSAFGTSAFANTSASSPFAALGASASSVFKPTTTGLSSFGPPAGSSGFGVLGSGFSGVGSGFLGATKPGGLTSFASPNAPATLGTKAKPLGAEESEDEEESGKDEEETDTFEAEKTDDRFFERTIETGEEEEETVFACKAKLFHFSKEWKERGIGTFKVNVRTGANGKKTGRMIMRADGAGRVMLNSPIFEGMTYGNAQNEAPDSKQILLASTEGGHTIPLLLRTGNEAYAKDAYEAIRSLLAGDKDSA